MSSPAPARPRGAHRGGARAARPPRPAGAAGGAGGTVVAGIVVTNVLGSPSGGQAFQGSAALAPGPAAARALAGRSTASPSGAASPAASAAPVTAAPLRAAVTVLNDSRITGLAARAAARLRAAGWPVAGIGNLPAMVPETTVYYDPGQRLAALALVQAGLGVRRAQPRGSWLARTGTLILVVTRDFPGA